MRNYPVAPNQKERLEAFYNPSMLNSLDKRQFDDIVLLASLYCKKPAAVITVSGKELARFEKKHGLINANSGVSICDNNILGINAGFSDEVSSNESGITTYHPTLNFYAGTALITGDGQKIGSLCVLDYEPGNLAEDQVTVLRLLASQATSLLELHRKNHDITNANKLLQRISSITAHDTRGPIRALQTIIGMKTDNNIGESDLDEMLPVIHTQLSATLNLLDNLLDWGKMQIEKKHTENRICVLRDLVQSCIEELKLTAVLKGNQLLNNVPASVEVNSNENALRFIVRNLLNNAIKFTSNGIVSVNYLPENNHHLIIVKDNGIGMLTEPGESEFERDRYPRQKGTNEESGSGLGLLLINEQLKKMNGQISVDSAPGQGTTVTVAIPF